MHQGQRDPSVEDRLKELLMGMLQEDDWTLMTTDIERYQKIKEIVTNAFKAVLELSPLQVKIVIQENINKLEAYDPIFEFHELEDFLTLVGILTTGMQSGLDDKTVDDYAAPHQAVCCLDKLVRINDEKRYSEENVSTMGAAIAFELKTLKFRLEKIDWKKGWKESDKKSNDFDDADYD
jgi:hypothetical protein